MTKKAVKSETPKAAKPKTIRVDANMFRLAALCADKSVGGRFYMAGVFIEPHAKGVSLVATDGHRMVVIYDEEGHADRAATIGLGRDMLKVCRPQKGDTGKRALEIDLDAGAVAKVTLPTALFASEAGAEIVGADFPDYRKIAPVLKKTRAAAAYQPAYLDAFGEIGLGLGAKAMIVHNDNPDAPGIVRWPDAPHAYGIIMPMRVEDKDALAGTLPDWFVPAKPESAVRSPEIAPKRKPARAPKRVAA